MGKGNRNREERKSSVESPNLKEIIYIDETELNSILAQIQGGLTTLIQAVKQVTEGSSNTSTETKMSGIGLGIPKVANGDLRKQNSDSNNNMQQQMTQSAISTVYNDYALQIVEKSLEKSNLIVERNSSKAGNILKLNSYFKIYNFNEISEALSSDSLGGMLASFGDSSPESQEGFDSAKLMMNVFNAFEKGINLISLNGAAVFAKKACFRMNSSQLQMLQNRDSKITVLGVVESIITPGISSINDFADAASKDIKAIGKFTATMNLAMLTQFGLAKENDRLIKPIAIYFE
ncbi:MAG: hypothetical protein ABF690_15285 [Liquorilactobacillus nagelii]|uniref:DUF6414 family protein n=1 Tax=Lactobacillaceae TaxID=33958 RepID=UPI0039EA535B